MPQTAAEQIDYAKIDANVTEQLLKLRGGQYDLGMEQAAKDSEQLILTELAKQGFTEAELAALQEKIQKSTFSSIKESAIQEEEDVTLMVMALQAKSAELGVDYDKLGTRNESELAQVSEAATKLAEARSALEAIKKSKAWFKASRIAAAEVAVTEAETEYARIDKDTLAAARARLRKVNWTEKFQAYIVQAFGVRDILAHRLEVIIIPRISVTETKLEDTYEQRKVASEQYEDVMKKIKVLEGEVSAARADLGQFDQQIDVVEYAAAQRRVNELQAQLLVLNENKGIALSTMQNMEFAVDQHEAERVTLLQLRKTQRILINVLTKTTQERIVSFQTALDVLKIGADQDQSANIARIGEELDLKNLERVMAIGHAADRLVLDMFERFPDRVAKASQLQQASVREHLRSHERYETLEKHARERYGIDIMAGVYDPTAGVSETAS